MGRRKIEIKAIKDDRNRSVTFLKRKGGLFKKAHELSVLCSVDVAVIIFGQNKKLYEFSSGDIRETLQRYTYYGGPHEHKGPSDFAGKGDGDDDDEDDDNMGSPPPEQPSPPHHGVPPHFQPHLNQPHMRSDTQSASPPMNGHAFHPPPQSISRPTSRTHSRRASSNLVPPNQRQPHAAQPPPHSGANHINYSYPPNASYYQNAAAQNMHVNHHQQQQHQNVHVQGHPSHFQHPHGPPPPHSQLQQMYLQEQRRHSMSPSFPIQAHHERMHQNPVVQTPPHIQRPFQSPPLPEPKGMPKSESLDSGRANAAQSWQQQELSMPDSSSKAEQGIRSQSIDMGSVSRNSANGTSPQQTFAQPSQPPGRAGSVSGGSDFATPSRMNSMQSDAKRPRLKVQIPSEQSENGSATGESSGKDGDRTSGATPVKASTSESTHSSGVVLPPPSPSASAILSAGATGPTNPFARPPPKSTGVNQGPTASLRDNETPISALPSRYLNDTFLASPSNLFPDWNFGTMSHNSLASPATYQPSPIRPERPAFKDDLPEKRKILDEEPGGTPNKKAKS